MPDYRKTDEAVAALSSEEYCVTQQSGTERPGTGKYLNNKQPGIYVDVVSGEPLFASSDKYESGCGWLSFTKPIAPAHVSELRDASLGMVRTEVAAIVDYSGMLTDVHELSHLQITKLPVLLVHGSADPIVPVAALHAAQSALEDLDIDVTALVSNDVGHTVDPVGLQMGRLRRYSIELIAAHNLNDAA